MFSRTSTGLISALFVACAAPVFAEGDIAKGEASFRKCKACHTVEPGGASRVGPNLHDVVGRKTGTAEGFKYSKAMMKLAEEGYVWTPEELDKFLENPKKAVPGTKMTFAGLKKPEERTDVIAYLTSLNPAGAEATEGESTTAPAKAN